VSVVESVAEDGDVRRCVSDRRCASRVNGKAREVAEENTFCDACFDRAADRIEALPEQYLRLHAMIGERQAGVDVNIKHGKPSSTVVLNLHVDTLMGNIVADVTSAAEVVAEKLAMRTDDGDPWEADRADKAEQVLACARILAPKLRLLAAAKGVGGREDDDPGIDVMFWNRAGTWHGVKTTTGVEMVKRLDYLWSLANFTLGHTRARSRRPLPCNRCHAYKVGRWAGMDHYDCQGCGARFDEDDLRRQDKILLELTRRGLINTEGRREPLLPR
jgi:hypothetical protein